VPLRSHCTAQDPEPPRRKLLLRLLCRLRARLGRLLSQRVQTLGLLLRLDRLLVEVRAGAVKELHRFVHSRAFVKPGDVGVEIRELVSRTERAGAPDGCLEKAMNVVRIGQPQVFQDPNLFERVMEEIGDRDRDGATYR